MNQTGMALNIVLFLAFLAFATVFIIGPSITSLAVARADSAHTGLSVSAVVLAIVFPVLAITLYVGIQAYKAIQKARQGS